MIKKTFLALALIFCAQTMSFSWGFFAHKRINRLAVFTLPPEMIGFFKRHIGYITEKAVNPDRRRYAVEGEAPRHYIDADVYGDSAIFTLPRLWRDAVAEIGEDTLQAYGIVPWHIQTMKYRLTRAFANKDVISILRNAADIGHYIGDANVPLHTTVNYNGQYTGQYGIHGFWESRLPELYSDNYDFFLGQAEYISDPVSAAWEGVINAHLALDSVLRFEKELTAEFTEDKKYSFEQRGNMITKVYSKPFSKEYHKMLNGQVERRMRASIKLVGDFWYTCWVDAGQPDLRLLLDGNAEELIRREAEEEEKELEKLQDQRDVPARPHDAYLDIKSPIDPHRCCFEPGNYAREIVPHKDEH